MNSLDSNGLRGNREYGKPRGGVWQKTQRVGILRNPIPGISVSRCIPDSYHGCAVAPDSGLVTPSRGFVKQRKPPQQPSVTDVAQPAQLPQSGDPTMMHGIVPKVGTAESDVGLAGGCLDSHSPGHDEAGGMSQSVLLFLCRILRHSEMNDLRSFFEGADFAPLAWISTEANRPNGKIA
jgi:hypothetical protein